MAGGGGYPPITLADRARAIYSDNTRAPADRAVALTDLFYGGGQAAPAAAAPAPAPPPPPPPPSADPWASSPLALPGEAGPIAPPDEQPAAPAAGPAPRPAGGWQPRTERHKGAAPWLSQYMGDEGQRPNQDPNAPAPWLQNYMGVPPAPPPPLEDPAASVDPNYEPTTTYTEDAARQATAFRGLHPQSITADEAGRTMDLAARERMGIQETFDAQEKARAEIAAKADEALTKQEAADAAVQQHEAERMRALQEMEGRYLDMANDLTSEPIDSNRLWNSQSTGENIMSRIALFLGALGAGISGTDNYIWEQIQRDIDRDIEAQKANKALQQNRLAAEESLIGMARQRFTSEAAAEEAMRASQYRRIEAELQRFAESAKTPERQAALQQMLIQADRSALQHEQAMRVAMQNDVAQQRARAMGPARKTPLQLAKERALLTGYEKDTVNNLREISGEKKVKDQEQFEIAPGLYARDKTEAKEVRNKLSDLEASDKALAALQKDVEANPGSSFVGGTRYPLSSKPISEKGANIASQKNIAVGLLGQLSGSGVVNPGEYPRLVKSLNTAAGIQGVRDNLAIKQRALIQGHAINPPPEKKKFAPTKERKE